MAKRAKKIYMCFILLGVFSGMQAQFTVDDFLKANGTVLRNQSGEGEIVNLRGTNLGSWLSMEHWIGPLGHGVVNSKNWEIAVSTHMNAENIENILDNNPATAWNSGVNQNSHKEQTVVIACNQTIVFDKIILHSGENTNEWPANFVIEISTDSTNWTEIFSGTVSSMEASMETWAASCNFIRLRQTGSSNSTWTIAEFYVLMNDDFSVRNAMYDRFGVEKTDSLWDYYQDLWITETDLDSIKSMGMNMVRVPFYWMEVMNNDGTIKENAFQQLDWVVAECKEREIYVILDLHGAPGGLDGYITSGQAVTNNLWTDSEAQQMTIELWKAIAIHYKGEPTVCAYDLLNEPVSTSSYFTISDMYDLIYKEVRKIDPDHVISVQAFYNFEMIDHPNTRGWENVLYQAHYYNTDYNNWDSQNGFINYALSDMARHQQEWNVPVLAGEYNFWLHFDLWGKWMHGLNSINASWSNWTYKNITSIRNWGLYLGNNNPHPEVSFDSDSLIKAKWDRFKTSSFTRNSRLIDTISKYSSGYAYKPVRKKVWFKAYNGSYISSENGSAPMTCNTFALDETEMFEIVDAGDGKIALKGNNGKYVTSNGGVSSMSCSRTEIGETEKFNWINLGNKQVALQGKGGFVSMEDGVIPINCNRSVIDGWEIFNWEKKDITNSESIKSKYNIEIFPNPVAGDVLYFFGVESGSSISIYNIDGRAYNNQIIDNYNSIDISHLSKGVYVVSINSDKILINKPIIVM